MQEDNAAVRGGFDILNQTLEVQTDGVFVVVTVLLDLKAGVLEDSVVVGPAGVGKVDLLCAGVEALEESTTDSQGTSARDSLSDDQAVFLDSGGVGAVGQLGSGTCEGGDTSDASVFLVATRSNNLVLGSADGRQNVGLTLGRHLDGG